ncbi:biliverdin-producing heme oxygenase [Stenotrophomonas sp. 24(2023)]|uniref:biliverdin-producing heme oxygenase n=1 Tax=Stenotrophomonas sp. 24(2023) TaxID=3068324 RepID=UPI0027DED9F5|nr:biliverdin-producing heme oxygenase [Stenotrophomonas sp. 24(2023)]WMJ69380.1 biliverdin-producing heme oxygenase [Stenotrophomonas sp. 24(2023)]
MPTDTPAAAPAAPTRAEGLKAATRLTHDRLDQRIMAARIFDDRERFAGFLRMQYRFHRDIEALYALPALQALLPDLAQRSRLARIAQDLADLGQPLPPAAAPRLASDAAVPTALGWLYVAEGSNLGGTLLYKLAAALGLDARFGARHLAAHPEGAARHWRAFTTALNTLVLPPDQEQAMVAGAQAAFAAVNAYVAEELP